MVTAAVRSIPWSRSGRLNRPNSVFWNYSGAVTFTVGTATISLSGLAVAAITGIALNAILPGKDYEFGHDQKGDTAVNFKV